MCELLNSDRTNVQTQGYIFLSVLAIKTTFARSVMGCFEYSMHLNIDRSSMR